MPIGRKLTVENLTEDPTMWDFACFAFAVAVFAAAALHAHARGELFRTAQMQPPLHRPHAHPRHPSPPSRMALS